MARKILGYIELIWTCDSCNTKNPGAIKSCTSCGAPQPLGVRFEQVDPNTFNFIKDEALIRMARSGPDKHCPYCGTRNVADALTCVQCGGDLTVGATSRPSGDVIEPYPVQGVQSNTQPPGEQPPMATRTPMPRGVSIIMILVLLAVCVLGVLFLINMLRTDAITAEVVSTSWERVVMVESYQLINASDWKANIPADAAISSCSLEYRYDSDQPTQNSEEICGTPYTIDTGTGVGQVVQDCYYRVFEDYCRYETLGWTVGETLRLTGSDLNPVWPAANLTNTQRIGQATETYTIWFNAGGREYDLRTSDYNLFQLAYPGSEWELEVNQLGAVTSAQPLD
ncbi:MAG TPA: zinc finger protein [Anaerolineaceae bacterium]|nr:zinc finger protein [Anaerolineaceae bacterium]